MSHKGKPSLLAGVFKLCYNKRMNIPGFSLFYLIKQFFFRIFRFLRHWYIDSFVFIWHKFLGVLEKFDRIFAVKITMRHWLEPLYQDKTIIGYILGFIFRTLRVFLGGIIYLVISIIGIAIYLAWAFIPFYCIYMIFK
ncbi:MAG TPA: hypothetical protein PLQ44_02295 [Candidatus Paceibacterota bacterium]|nr:hypothetical protein [Candidatus Paceibacterota bacterium]